MRVNSLLKNMKTKFTIFFTALFFIFLYLSFYPNTSKNQYVKKIKILFPITFKEKIKESNFFQKFYVYKLTKEAKKSFSNKKKLRELRKEIIEENILDKEQITFIENSELLEKLKTEQSINSNFRLLGVNFYGTTEYGVLEYADKKTPDNKLFIYIDDHPTCTYSKKNYAFDSFIKIKKHYSNKGFDFLSLCMSNIAWNSKQVDFPGIDKNARPMHEIYKNFYDKEYQNKKPLSLMLSGNYYLINKVLNENKYERVDLVGLTGGGWYATLLSAVIPEIQKSISWVGTIPITLRFYLPNKGDWEQEKSKFWTHNDYWDLYYLSTLDKNFQQSRKHYQVYIENHKYAFNGPFAKIMKSVSDELKNKYFKVIFFSENSRSVDLDTIIPILEK